MAKMTKSQLMNTLAEKCDCTKKDAQQFLEMLTELAYSEVEKSGEFTIPGIGKLVLRKRPKRKGRNPATGEAIQIPAKTVVKFMLSKTCKDAIIPPKK